MRRSSLRTPGRRGGGQAAPVRDHPGPGPSGGCALCVPQSAGHEHRHQDSKARYSLGVSVLCGQSTATRSSAAGSLPLRKPAVGTNPPARLLRSRSSVRLRRGYTCLLFLHTSAGMNPAGSVPGRQEAAVPAAGADIVSLVSRQAAAQAAKDCAGGSVPGLTAKSVLPPFQQWAVPAQAPEAVCPPHKLSVFVGVWEPEVSQPLRRQSPPPPLSSRPPPGPRSSRFAPSAPLVTGKLVTGPRKPTALILPATRLPATKADQEPTPQPHQENDRQHPPEGTEPNINIWTRKQRLAPLRAL